MGTIEPLAEKLNDKSGYIVIIHRVLYLIVLCVEKQKQNNEHKQERNKEYFVYEIERGKGRW